MKIIAIVGPTGIGKTRLSLELAKTYNAEIINCDSMQIYKELNIGTAKILDKENIKHHMLDICSIDDEYSVYNYQQDARKILDKLIKDNKNVIIVGGTGLYLKALLYDYKFNNKKYADYKNEDLYNLLIKDNKDININNRRQLISKLENETSKLLYDVCFIGLTTSRDKLYELINNRVDKMFEDGLLEEARKLYNKNIKTRAIKTAIGYKELYSYFEKNITLEEAADLIKQRTRNYAKRQYTWFNNKMNINWVDVDFDDFSNTVNMSIKLIKE